MAEYTSRHTGLKIDEALDSALNVKQVRGIVKMTDAGPVAAVPDEDFIADSGSIVPVTGLLKGVRNAETNKIEVQQATAGTDYQTPLTAGADYATPSVVVNKQNKITAQGLLKGLGDGSVAAAEAGVDYQAPILAGAYATPDNVSAAVSDHNSNDSAHSAQFGNKQDKIQATGLLYNSESDGLTGYPVAVTGDEILDDQKAVPSVKFMTEFVINSVITGENIAIGDIPKFSADATHAFFTAAIPDVDYIRPPSYSSSLPTSGTALTANTIYTVSGVGTYTFTAPTTGNKWAHGKFTTDSTVNVSFNGTFQEAAPSIEANKAYEFDVFDGVWAIQEVVSA